MVVNDPIADMLTRIRNGQVARHDAVTMPASNTKKAIAKILLNEGYIKAVDFIDDGLQGEIKITLKYLNGKQTPVIAGLKRISRDRRGRQTGAEGSQDQADGRNAEEAAG